MKKRILSFGLALVMLAGLCVAASASNGFSDVSEQAWYADAVQYVAENHLMSGVGEDRFAPDVTMTRSMAVTVLHQLAGSPEPQGENPFTDIADDAWYTNAVLWAVENNITSGSSATTFSPDAAVSREQLVTFLYQYAWLAELHMTAEDISSFSDFDQISDFAVPAFEWAASAGIVSGDEQNRVCPTQSVTRAQCAAMLMKFHQLIQQNSAAV